ncbi:hypothetical protein V6N13_066395 [Hibiscus sabdariffa]
MGSGIPTETKKGKSKNPQKAKESILKQKSPAEFFAENKNIAGFDNVQCNKNYYSAESISELPVIEITIEEIIKSKFNSMIGLVDRERIDEALYDDYETAKSREDNGRGMPHDDIPNMFGRVLSGTKYGLKQTRGKFGLGAKMVILLTCALL